MKLDFYVKNQCISVSTIDGEGKKLADRLLLLKCYDRKLVKSLKDLIIIDLVLGGEPTKKKKKKKKKQ